MKRLLLNRILLMLTLFGSQHYVTAQITPNALAFPSANNNFLGTISNTSANSEVDVDLYTGTGQINVPICKVGSKELTIPISLSYTGARGIKVQEYASSVGLGWTLNAGGNISRVVRGWPDERPEGFLGTNHWGQNVANAINNGSPLASQLTGSANSNPTADGEPDIFFVRTPFFAAQFTFDEFGQPVFSNSTGLKVISTDFYSSYNYSNSSFKVIDEAGNQYLFGTKENTITKLYGTNYTFPTTWYLDRIITFDGKDDVQFGYTSTWANDVYTHYQSVATYSYTGCTKTDNTTTTSTIQYPKFISSIWTTTGYVSFTYANDRRDVVNSSRLVSIQLQGRNGYNQTQLQTYRFNHSYFGDPSSVAEALRLKLDKITVAGNSAVTKTPLDFKTFTYFTGENLPPHSSNKFDYWGYYTSFAALIGSDDPMQYPQLRQATYERTKANVLIGIKDISGGGWTINYDHNSYPSGTSSNHLVGGLRVMSIVRTLPSGETLTRSFNYNGLDNNSSGQILTGSFANLVYVWGSWYYWQVMSETPSNVYDLNGNFIGYSRVKVTEPNGGYTITEFNNFSDFQDIFTYLDGYDQNTVPNVVSSTSRAFKRGQPKNQTVYTSANKKVSQEVYTYTSLTNPVSRKSWGFHWLYAGFSICNTSSSTRLSSTFSTLVENFRTTQIVYRDYDQIDDTRYVEKTVNVSYADNKRLVRTMSTTDSKGVTQSRTSYYPEDVSSPGIPMITSPEQTAMSSLISLNKLNPVVHESISRNGTTTQMHNGFTSYTLGLDTKVFHTSTTDYKESNVAKKLLFNYDLETSNLISTKDDNGKSTSYFYNYNESLPVAKVVNAASTTTATQQPYLTYGNYFYLNNTYSSSFTSHATGDVIIQLYDDSWTGYSNVTEVYYSLYGPVNMYGTMCISQNPSGQCWQGDINEVTLPNMPPGNYTLYCSYNSTVPGTDPYVYYYYTSVTASYDRTKEFYYEGFEAWSGNANGGHTGLKSYNGNYTVYFTPPDSRPYKIQWWQLTGGVWDFQEANYTYPYTISGGNIDDVRVFPADALMTSFTYEPEVGMTAETDPSGRSTYYEYDGFGRPNIIRDNDKKIAKKYCYNYAGQSNGCAIFANTPQSGTFTRNNCPSGIGMQGTYTVAEGKYFSEISQADANQQAVNDVNANGQNYVNENGGCQNIYVRLRKEITYTYYDPYYTYEYANFILQFYSDNGYTPVTLQGPLTVNLHYYSLQQYYPNYSYTYNSTWPITIDAGYSDYWYTSEEITNCTTGPNYWDFNCTQIDYWLEPGNNYIIIY